MMSKFIERGLDFEYHNRIHGINGGHHNPNLPSNSNYYSFHRSIFSL